ncbi:MAG: NAD-dependent epimerase/dehydratase family protein, partial [Chthoniobacterales bacterium]
MKNIGITGATGFIGQEVARQAAASGFEVTGFSRSAGRSAGKS